jgi:lipopolysaccharide export system protein LptA
VKIRRSEILVILSALAFAAVLVVSFRPGRRPSAHGRSGDVPAPEGVRGQATTLLDGFDFTEESGGKPMLRIKADRTVGYGPAAGLAPDLYAGEKVALTLFPDDGSHPVTVHGDRGTYDERTRDAKVEGNVHWNDEQEASMAETSEGNYRPATRTLEAPKPVHFTRGSIELNAPSARYDLNEKALHLAGPLNGTGGGKDSAGLSKLTARSGIYRREEGVLELETVDTLSTAGDRYAADHMTVKMGSHGGRTEWMHGVGNVHGILAPGRTTQSTPTPTTDAVERQYTADESLLNFDAAGKPSTLTLTGSPAILWEPKQRLTAPKIELSFSEGRLAAAKAWGGLRLEGEQSRGQADHGSLGFSPEGAAQNVVLEGSVVVESEGRKGDAAKAVELDAAGLWLLTGDANHAARVQSGADRLSADRIELDRPHQQVRGQGRARAVLGADAQKRERTVTFIGDPKRPSYGKADRIALDDKTRVATLSGNASLWQDDSSLFADDITLSDVEKTVTAVQNVRAVLAPDKAAPTPVPKSSKKPPPARAASVVTSKRMLYKDSDRSGRFEGGVVVTRGTGWRATGGESTAWLNQDQGVDCMEISGDVDLADHTVGRTAKAEKVVDYPKQGKSILWGAPARVTEASGNQVAGAVLTIYDQGGRVEVTAPEGGKTETIHRTDKD